MIKLQQTTSSHLAIHLSLELHKILRKRSFDSDDIEQLIDKSRYGIHHRSKYYPKWWIRLTLPLAIMVGIIMFIALPLQFIVRGKWKYEIDWISNWFKALGF